MMFKQGGCLGNQKSYLNSIGLRVIFYQKGTKAVSKKYLESQTLRPGRQRSTSLWCLPLSFTLTALGSFLGSTTGVKGKQTGWGSRLLWPQIELSPFHWFQIIAVVEKTFFEPILHLWWLKMITAKPTNQIQFPPCSTTIFGETKGKEGLQHMPKLSPPMDSKAKV